MIQTFKRKLKAFAIHIVSKNYRAMAKTGMKSLEEISKIDFNSPKLKKEYEKIKRKNKELLESTKPDWRTMHRTFDV